jgi:hypothetical protein
VTQIWPGFQQEMFGRVAAPFRPTLKGSRCGAAANNGVFIPMLEGFEKISANLRGGRV